MKQEHTTQQDLLDALAQKQAQIEKLEAQLAEQKRISEASRYNAQLLDFVLDAVISADLNFNIKTWNKAAEEMYGWTAEEVQGRYATELFQTNYFDGSTPEQTQKQYREQGIWRGEMIHHHRDGTPIPVRGASGTIYDDTGKAVGAVTVLRDISDELKAQRILRESEQRYRIISELMSDYAFLYHLDHNGEWYRVWTTEDAFKRVTGYERGEIQGTYGLYHPDEIENVKRDIERTLAGEDTEGEYQIITKDGETKWIYIHRRILWDKSGQQVIGFYGAGKDITTRKRAEERQLEYNKERERVNVLQNFIQDVSHDLKTPLSTVNTSIYILRKLATSDKQLAQIEKLEVQITRLSKLLEDMFEMSRLDLISHLSLTRIDLTMYLQNIVQNYQSRVREKHIKLQSDFGDSPVFILADVSTLTRAINNIIENAIQFTPENGRITIQTRQEKSQVVITITDTGVGIPPEEIAFIFAHFYRSDKSRNSNTVGSSGLGLAIARKIIELHGGSIIVNSTVGSGTSFSIQLSRLI